LNSNRAGKPNRGTSDFQDRGFIGQFHGGCFGGSTNLAFVGRVVAAQQDRNGFPSA
jgi:hypothetical protein